ncbi:MAG: radical SAM protein [Candidatus Jordarchaeaceae archaeon]
MNGGVPIVLTADRTLMSNYFGGMFLGFSSCVPAGFIPSPLYYKIFSPPVRVDARGAAVLAPYGTRKIEAALLEYGFDEKDVIVTSPEHLPQVIGPNTKVVGITETDPLGIGPATTTFRGLFGGLPLMAWEFLLTLLKIRLSGFKPKIFVGGPGAWQLDNQEIRRVLGISCVVIGEGDTAVPPLFEKAFRGEKVPEVVYTDPVPLQDIPLIRRPSVCGLVEIARGCGRGCKFCTPTLKLFRCPPIDYILKEVEVNLRSGSHDILLHAEDVLRYKAKGLSINNEAVISLFQAVKNYLGVEWVEVSHFALSSVAAAPQLIEEISGILNLDAKNWLSGQTGIETGSPRMAKQHMYGKCKPFSYEEWPDVVVRAFEVLSENHWVPVSTLILGLPQETEEDIWDTIYLVRMLRNFKSLIVPLFFVAMGSLGGEKSFTIRDMKPEHVELLFECWEHNFKWLPALVREYRGVKSLTRRRILSLITWFASLFARQIIHQCREEYGNNIQKFISDYDMGRIRKGILRFTKLYDRILKTVTRTKNKHPQSNF